MVLQITEHRRHAAGLADLLLYDALIDDGILLLQDGALLAGWSFRGPDLASATHEEMAALSARLSSILRLGSGWMIQCDAIRSLAPGYPEEGHFPDLATRLIDAERREGLQHRPIVGLEQFDEVLRRAIAKHKVPRLGPDHRGGSAEQGAVASVRLIMYSIDISTVYRI